MTSATAVDLDAAALAFALRSRTTAEVRFDAGSRHLYATDASNYRHVPIGVVAPRTVEDLVETVRVCAEHGAPVTSRGAGTSLAGQTANVAVIVDCSRHLDRILELDPVARTARVQPGVVLDDLRDAAEQHGLTFGPDPSTHDRCTLGGMIGNNACGVHSISAGRTVDNVIAMDVLLSDGTLLTVGRRTLDEVRALAQQPGRVGEIHRGLLDLRDRARPLVGERFPDIPRRVSGYNLDELLHDDAIDTARALVGTEGTCVVVLAATLRLVPSPPVRTMVVLGYDDLFRAGAWALFAVWTGPRATGMVASAASFGPAPGRALRGARAALHRPARGHPGRDGHPHSGRPTGTSAGTGLRATYRRASDAAEELAMTHHDEDEHEGQPGPAEDADPATQADMGMGGTPAAAYSPEGMDDDADEDGGTYQPDEDGGGEA